MSEALRFEVGKPGVDPTLPNITLSINGEDFSLAYDFAAIVLVEKATGINLLSSVIEEPTFQGIVALFWAAVLKSRPDFTLEKAAGLIDLQSVLMILHAVRVAWGASIPDPVEAEASRGKRKLRKSARKPERSVVGILGAGAV